MTGQSTACFYRHGILINSNIDQGINCRTRLSN